MEPLYIVLSGMLSIPLAAGLVGGLAIVFVVWLYYAPQADRLRRLLCNAATTRALPNDHILTEHSPPKIDLTPQPTIEPKQGGVLLGVNLSDVGADFWGENHKSQVQIPLIEDNSNKVEQPPLVFPPPNGNTQAIKPKRPTTPIPPMPKPLPSPKKKFVRIKYDQSDIKTYDYLPNIEITDLSVGDIVLVYAKDPKEKRRKKKDATRKLAIVHSFSKDGEVSFHANSPVTLKIEGKYMASQNGKKYHDPRCKEMENVTPGEAIWFIDEADAKRHGYECCKKCFEKYMKRNE